MGTDGEHGGGVRLGLLGPLLVADDVHTEVDVGAERLRILLAALLVRANRTVSVDELAEIVWDGRPPAGSARTVRRYVQRLRHVVGRQVAARIITRDPGYVCRCTDTELDLLRVEALCRHGANAMRDQEWLAASQAFTQALRLWRGAPLEDIRSQVLRDESVPRLDQLRLQILEDRIAAELNLGDAGRLAPELMRLTIEHPLRERFHAQLMLSLARAGRRAEALEVYQRVRRALVDELGVEPGTELRRVHAQVIAGDVEPTEAAPSASPASGCRRTGQPVPRQLPASTWYFTGRESDLNQLTTLVEGFESAQNGAGLVAISVICGMAGVGKTALAVHAAHLFAPRFSDGQLFVDLHGYTQGYAPREPADVLEVLLRALNLPPHQIPAGLDERAAVFRQRLAGTRTLILLDNAASETQVRPLLPGISGCLVIITSRRQLKGLHDVHSVTLDVLPEADAVTLLVAAAGHPRMPAGAPETTEIVHLCGRLPLALRMAASLLAHRPLWTAGHLAGLLRSQRRQLIAISDGERDLATVFDLSYRSLTEAQQGLFRRLGLVLGPDVDASAAAALLEADPTTASMLLEDLVDHNLLTEHAPGRYRLHDLIREHTRTLAGSALEANRDAEFGRLPDCHHTAGWGTEDAE